MPIPDFQTMLLPVLRSFEDGAPHPQADTLEKMSRQFELTDAEVAELLPSGKARRFDNRVRWAKVHLQKAGLLESPRRGEFQITKRGRDVLARRPSRLDMQALREFPEYRAFRAVEDQAPVAAGGDAGASASAAVDATPEEQIGRAFLALNAELAESILETLKRGSPAFFERVVVDLLRAMGYGGSLGDAGRVVGRSGDGGIDGIIKEDKLGLDVVYIQAKRWDRTVGRPDVQGFAGSLDGVKSRRGVMITTSTFSNDARRFAEQIEKKIVLIDGEELAALMIEHGVGVVERERYVLKRIDGDYFAEE